MLSRGDITVTHNGLSLDEGLVTQVLICLFTDAVLMTMMSSLMVPATRAAGRATRTAIFRGFPPVAA
ncbi:hypothetical protein [Escherichia coli]|uniref:hypothetical protein n=1 Tax=Escherichia coli TaxID=562 RepID=UPI003B27D650